jgi:hypothetical protein
MIAALVLVGVVLMWVVIHLMTKLEERRDRQFYAEMNVFGGPVTPSFEEIDEENDGER